MPDATSDTAVTAARTPAPAAFSEAAARPLRERMLRPTFPELWTFLAVALPALAGLVRLPTLDLAYQLRAGADILAGRGIPTTDAWTFTAAGQPWLDQQWGAQVILAAIYDVGGWTGLTVFRAAILAVVFGLLLVAVRWRAPRIGGRIAAWLTLAAFIVAAPALSLRPQLLGVAGFVVMLVVLAGRRERPGLVWLLPAIAVAWANVHGSFVLAPALAGLAWLEDLRERSPHAARMLLVTVATGAATLVTPFGSDGWRYAVTLSANSEVRTRVIEWQPPTLTDIPGILFWGSVVLVAVAVLVIARRRGAIAWPALLTLGAFGVLAAVAVRGIAWWPPVAAVTIAALAFPAQIEGSAHVHGPRRVPRGSPLNALIAAVLIIAGVGLLPVWRTTDPGTGAPSGLLVFAPSGVTAALRGIAGPDDRVWNPQPWGSWLEFAVPAPAYAFDSLIEVIPPEVWAEGDVVTTAGPGWDSILDRRGVTIVVAEGGQTAPLASALAKNAGWRLVHADTDGTVWVRADR